MAIYGQDATDALDQEKVSLYNSSGNETGTASTPIRVDPIGSTPQPVSNTSLSSIDSKISKTNNNAAPSTDNIGALGYIAQAGAPSLTNSNLVAGYSDLLGSQRVRIQPPAGSFYSWYGSTGTYNSFSANTPLFSMRWTSATKLLVIMRVEIMVVTSSTANNSAITERQLIIARNFTASDTGGTAVSFTGNNQKARTSFPSSAMGDMRIGNPISAGTRTLDSSPYSSVMGWSGTQSTGFVIGAFGSSSTNNSRTTEGGAGFAKLLDSTNGQEHPIVCAQNEGIVVRIGSAQPSGSTQQSYIRVYWAEVDGY